MPDLFCYRLDDMRRIHPKMQKHRCDLCRAIVGVFPSGQEVIRLHTRAKIRIICNHCGEPGADARYAPGAYDEKRETVPKEG